METMRRKILFFLFIFLFLHSKAIVPVAQHPFLSQSSSWAFEENKGQVTGRDSSFVKYFYKKGNLTMFLLNGGIAYQFEKTHYPKGYNPNDYFDKKKGKTFQEDKDLTVERETYRMDIELIGANTNCEILTEGKSADYIQDYNHNALGIHSYQKVTYKNIYPHIDWVFYINSGDNKEAGVKYDFIVHPGGDPHAIKMKPKWVEAHNIKSDGSLTLVNRMGSITEKPPVSFQRKKEIETHFKIYEDIIHFEISSYDTSQILRIDPSVIWSTYYGGNENEFCRNIQTDQLGNVYFGGTTQSTTNIDFGGYNYAKTSGVGGYGFVAKFSPKGQRLWASYYGHSQYPGGIAIDSKNNLYLAVSDLLWNNVYLSYNGFRNKKGGGLLVKFDPAGNRIWATYYGNSTQQTFGLGCAVDKEDNVYLSGMTISTDSIAYQGYKNYFSGTPSAANFDIYLVKFDSAGNRLWGTYYGVPYQDYGGRTICTDNENNVYLTGYSYYSLSTSLFYKGFDSSRGEFIVKFSPTGTRLWSSYTALLNLNSLSVDISNNLYIVGNSEYTSGVALNGFQNTYGGGSIDGCVLKISPNGQKIWGTYYGGNGEDAFYGSSISRDSKYLYLCGGTSSTALVPNGVIDPMSSSYGPGIFLAKFDTSGNRHWAYYFVGDSGFVSSISIHESKVGGLYLLGATYSTNGVAYKAFQSSNGGKADGFLAKIGNRPALTIRRVSNDTLCPRAMARFEKDSMRYGGTSPQYTWYLNGTQIGNDTFVSFSALSHGDTVYCVLHSNETDRSDDTVWSNKLVVYLYIPDTTHLYDTICSNQPLGFNNQLLSSTGLYRDTFMGRSGCDSFVFLHLEVTPTKNTNISYTTPCASPSYYFNGQNRTTSGLYRDTFISSVGCDSFILLNLTVKSHTNYSYTHSICPNQSYYFDGQNRTTKGTYTQIISNSMGCDSTITLTLKVLDKPTQDSQIFQECNPFVFQGKTFTSSTQFLDTILSVMGCDSIIRTYQIYLTPIATIYLDTTIYACDSLRVGGVKYESSFKRIDTLKKTIHPFCDSIYQTFNYQIAKTPVSGLKKEDSFLRNSTIILRPNIIKNYLWSTGSIERELNFKLENDVTLYLISWNSEYCKDTANIRLIALDLAIIGLPTAFSPTGEKPENRTFRPNINGKLESFHMIVFNRWGEKVYETYETNPIGWNGLFKGIPAKTGSYAYYIEYRTLGSIFTKSGEVLLIW